MSYQFMCGLCLGVSKWDGTWNGSRCFLWLKHSCSCLWSSNILHSVLQADAPLPCHRYFYHDSTRFDYPVVSCEILFFIVGILYLVEKFVATFQTFYKYQVLENCSCITLSLSLILHILTWSLWWKCWCLWSSTALTTLGFFLLHTFSMIIAFNGYTKLNRTQQLFVPVMHLGASLLVRSASCSSILIQYLIVLKSLVFFRWVLICSKWDFHCHES